jgi:hypothetical protein
MGKILPTEIIGEHGDISVIGFTVRKHGNISLIGFTICKYGKVSGVQIQQNS